MPWLQNSEWNESHNNKTAIQLLAVLHNMGGYVTSAPVAELQWFFTHQDEHYSAPENSFTLSSLKENHWSDIDPVFCLGTKHCEHKASATNWAVWRLENVGDVRQVRWNGNTIMLHFGKRGSRVLACLLFAYSVHSHIFSASAKTAYRHLSDVKLVIKYCCFFKLPTFMELFDIKKGLKI